MKYIYILLITLISFSSYSQGYVHSVLVLNEGYFDYANNQIVTPPTLGVYYPSSSSYVTVDTLHNSRFASDIVIHEDYIYVAADNVLYKYDRFNHAMISSANISGIRNIAIWNDKLFVSRGDYDSITFGPILYNSYLQVYNTSDLSFLHEFDTITGPKWSTQNMIINNDTLYVAVNNAYEFGNEKGLIGVVELNTLNYLNELDLGPDGKNPDNLIYDSNTIYSVNNKDWSGASISTINLTNYNITTTNLSSNSTGCGTSCFKDNKILYQISMDTELFAWDTQSMLSSGVSLGFSTNFYDLSYDNINGHLYASETDYFSYGLVKIYDYNNNLINSFNCGISPGNIVFDVRSQVTSVDEDLFLNINRSIFDSFGRSHKSLKNKPAGVYFIDGKKVFLK